MSGNPFRRPHPNRLSEQEQRDDLTPPPNISATKKKKSVKIRSPPHSPEEVPRRLSAGRTSPPPPVQSTENGDDSDSTATADSELEQALVNTRRNSGSLPSLSDSGTSLRGAPHNPFARTLATNEAAFGLQQAQHQVHTVEEHEHGRGGRPALDVDAFKNILLTGSAAPSPPASMRSQRPQDSSSNTDASSISRSSLFDPYLEAHPESPRSSFDQDESLNDFYDNEEGSRLMTGAGRLDDLAPPAPPKPNSRNPVGLKGPQTVSFADFEDSFPPPAGYNPSVENNTKANLRPPSLRRSPSDLNKPLPAPPQGPNSPLQASFGNSTSHDAPGQQPVSTVVRAADVSELKKAVPPPPPASRRVGQHTPGQGRTRGSSNATQDPPLDQDFSTTLTKEELNPKSVVHSVPPPPPSRKARPTSQTAVTSTETPPQMPSPAPSGSEMKAMPPPPPRRNPSKSGSAVPRSSSIPSHPYITRQESPSSTRHNAPPAPPPRRGANSQRTSMDGPRPVMDSRHASDFDVRRTSSASTESGRAPPHSSLQRVVDSAEEDEEDQSPPAEPTASNDILADMAKLQNEIDKLRTGQG